MPVLGRDHVNITRNRSRPGSARLHNRPIRVRRIPGPPIMLSEPVLGLRTAGPLVGRPTRLISVPIQAKNGPKPFLYPYMDRKSVVLYCTRVFGVRTKSSLIVIKKR